MRDVEDRTEMHSPRAHRLLGIVVWVQVPLMVSAVGLYVYVGHRLKSQLQEMADNSRTIQVQKQQIEAQTAALGEVQAVATASGSEQLKQQIQNLIPVTSQVKIEANAQQTKMTTRDGSPIYNFSLQVKGPPEALARIAKVTYEFNNATFKSPVKESADRNSGFKVGYTGWGCLSSVIVTFTLVSPSNGGPPPAVDFDQCKAMGW